MTDIPEVFDWVTARSQCSVEAVYIALRETVESDMKKMQELFPRTRVGTFQVNPVTTDRFIAIYNRDLGGVIQSAGVVFERLDTAIHVRTAGPNRNESALFMAKPTLASDGRCVLEVDGRGPLHLWQVSKLALEDLLFGGNL